MAAPGSRRNFQPALAPTTCVDAPEQPHMNARFHALAPRAFLQAAAAAACLLLASCGGGERRRHTGRAREQSGHCQRRRQPDGAYPRPADDLDLVEFERDRMPGKRRLERDGRCFRHADCHAVSRGHVHLYADLQRRRRQHIGRRCGRAARSRPSACPLRRRACRRVKLPRSAGPRPTRRPAPRRAPGPAIRPPAEASPSRQPSRAPTPTALAAPARAAMRAVRWRSA